MSEEMAGVVEAYEQGYEKGFNDGMKAGAYNYYNHISQALNNVMLEGVNLMMKETGDVK